MKLRPLNNHLIVKASSKEEVSKSGIVLPDTIDQERPAQGEVIAVGPGKMNDQGQRIEMTVKVGDQVVFKNIHLMILKLMVRNT